MSPRIVSLETSPTTDVTVFSSEDDRRAVGSITMVVRDHLNAATATSLLHTDWTFLEPGTYIDRNIVQGNLLTLQRNEAVQRMRGDWLLFIDDDMVWKPDAIGRLVKSAEELQADILGALTYRRSAPHSPTMFMREMPHDGGYNFLESWDKDVIEVDATGMAFVIINKRVFEAIAGGPMPPYEERAGGNPPNFFRWEGTLGEDLRFCQDARSAGARIFVDTRIEVGHMAEVEIRYKHFLMEMLDRDPETLNARRTLNDRMGLPTMEAHAIRSKLGWNV
jgi:glycosyltransferase involved in cell wall biosynthesis